MAKLRREIIEPKSGGGGGGKGEGFDVARTGDARVGFVGFPSVGKSTLLSNLAGVYSEVAAYEFTTLTTVPGVIRYKGPVRNFNTCIFTFDKKMTSQKAQKFNYSTCQVLLKVRRMAKVAVSRLLPSLEHAT